MRTIILVSCLLSACLPGDAAEPQRIVLQGDDVEVSQTALAFPSTTHPEFDPANVNDLVAGTSSGGFLRRILDIKLAGGLYTVATENVDLAEAIGDGTSEQLNDGKADGGSEGFLLGVVANDKAIYADGNFSIDVTRAALSFKPTVDIDLQVANTRLEHFLVKATGRLEGELGIKIDASAGGEVKVEKPLWSTEKTFIQWIGWVPVVEVAELTIGVGVEVEAEGAFQAEFDAAFTAQLTAGVEYVGGQWKNLGTATMQRRGNPTRASGEGEVTINSFVYAEVQIRLYGVAGPFIEVKPNIRFRREPDGRWVRSVGVFAEAGAELALPFGDETLLRYMSKVFDYEYPL